MRSKKVTNKLFVLLILAPLLLLLSCYTQKNSTNSFWVEGKVLVESDIGFERIGNLTLKLDMASPKGTGPFPALVYIFGSGWGHWGGDKSLYYHNIVQAAKKGYVAVAIKYRQTSVKEDGKTLYYFPAQIYDAKAAVRWLRANCKKYNVDQAHIGAIGFSSGGHLSLLLAFTSPEDGLEGDIEGKQYSSRVQAVVSSAGPVDLRENFANPESQAAIRELIGGSMIEFPEMYKKASPVTFAKNGSPPVLLIHGSNDDEVPLEQAVLLEKVLKEKGVPHELIVKNGSGHVDATMAPEVLDFMDKYLKIDSH